MKIYIFIFFALIITIVFQVFLENIKFLVIKPNLILLLVIFFSLQKGTIFGMVFGFIGGLILNSISYNNLCFFSLQGTIIGFICGEMKKYRYTNFIKFIIAILGIFFFEIMSLIISTIRYQLPICKILFLIIIPKVFISCIFLLPIFLILDFILINYIQK